MGGDLLVRGAVALARRLNVPPVVVAATVVGFGTSLPEMLVSIQATITGVPDLILGNVVGSNIANVLLVGGASAVVYPLLHDDRELRRNVLLMSASLLAFTAFAATRDIGTVDGVILLVAFFVMMAATARSTIQGRKERDPSTPLDWVLGIPSQMIVIGVFIVSGIVMLPLGANLLVDSAVQIAQRFEVPEAVIGLTVLAVGTSLPELTTTVLAAMERRSDVAIGAIIGSNTFNILTIMGLAAAISPSPIEVSSRMMFLDIPFMLVTSGALGIAALRGRSIGRRVGITMLVGYVVYLTTLVVIV
ncbi:MAG: calcium/sodium antiporter [Gemmatimonadetes bacterium]|nr:calcium/sodium antiporter [Gemmatimonadota bacterium]NNF14360.1 calcium/sodium antiporter [Gemmatimonadota bacterium]NNL29706.1 calcium/sodium antiporter [Gemmatimonadota bacterium]